MKPSHCLPAPNKATDPFTRLPSTSSINKRITKLFLRGQRQEVRVAAHELRRHLLDKNPSTATSLLRSPAQEQDPAGRAVRVRIECERAQTTGALFPDRLPPARRGFCGCTAAWWRLSRSVSEKVRLFAVVLARLSQLAQLRKGVKDVGEERSLEQEAPKDQEGC